MANAENGLMYDRIKKSLKSQQGVVVGEAERHETVFSGTTGSKSFVSTIFVAPEQPIDINTESKSVEEQLFAMDDIDRFNEASSRLIQDVQPVFQRPAYITYKTPNGMVVPGELRVFTKRDEGGYDVVSVIVFPKVNVAFRAKNLKRGA